MSYEAFLYYAHGWIQAVELLLVIWLVAWAGSRVVDFCRAGMERVRRLDEREGKK
jgi:hypothetical protein